MGMYFTCCENCKYYYQDEVQNDKYIVRTPPYCHWTNPDDIAPCEPDRYNYLGELQYYEEE